MSTVAYEQVLEAVRTLSPEEVQKLVQQINAEQPPPSAAAASTNGTTAMKHSREREMRWLSEHEAEYAGQWLALDGDRLVSRGEDMKAVFAEAEAQGVGNPFMAYAESNEPAMGGWL